MTDLQFVIEPTVDYHDFNVVLYYTHLHLNGAKLIYSFNMLQMKRKKNGSFPSGTKSRRNINSTVALWN